MYKDLMTSRRFAPLFWCQFCSALNDNFLKNALGMLILFGLGSAGSAYGDRGNMLVALATVVFIAPFFILSALGGELADRFDKGYVAARIKLAEIPVAALAAVGFFLHSVEILFVTLALFGVMAALFGPVKYGILPEKLETAELPAGNALVEGATFLAILIGTIAGGIAVKTAKSPELVVGIIVALAVVSWIFARGIPVAGPAAPGLAITANPWTSTFALVRELKRDPRLWSGAAIVSWFWVVGSAALSLLPPLVKDYIGGNEDVVTLCLATFVVGIAAGSALGAQASHGKPNLTLVPLGAALMGVFSLAVAGLAGLLPRPAASIGPLAVLGYGHRACAARRAVRPGGRRGALHRACVRRRAGVGAAGRPRPRDCRGQRHQRRLDGGGGGADRRPAGRGRGAGDPVRRARRTEHRRGLLCDAGLAGGAAEARGQGARGGLRPEARGADACFRGRHSMGGNDGRTQPRRGRPALLQQPLGTAPCWPERAGSAGLRAAAQPEGASVGADRGGVLHDAGAGGDRRG